MKKFNPEIWLVERQKFQPEQWLQKTKAKNIIETHWKMDLSKHEETEIVVSRVEAVSIDLTADYHDWIKNGICFCFRIWRIWPGFLSSNKSVPFWL